LGGVEAGPFLLGHDSIGLGFILHVIDAVLLLFQLIRLMLSELAAGNSPVDALLLIGLSLIDPGRLGLSIGHPGCQENAADDKNSGFHSSSCWW
jgi:hypothetical protein